MIVTVVSRCERAALSRTRRIVDLFLPRVADTTWIGNISAEALEELRKRLAERATRRSAVRCYGERRGMVKLLWAVGSTADLESGGCSAAIGTTQHDMLRDGDEVRESAVTGVLRQIVRLAALFHDLGKATRLFQTLLRGGTLPGKAGQPIRHEVVSATLIASVIGPASNDVEMLAAFIADDFPDRLSAAWPGIPGIIAGLMSRNNPAQTLPPCFAAPENLPIFSALLFAIFSHHRAPGNRLEEDKDPWLEAHLHRKVWEEHYAKPKDRQRWLTPDPDISQGLPWINSAWSGFVQAAAKRLLDLLPALSGPEKTALPRLAAQIGRLALQWGDHAVSGEDSAETGQSGDKAKDIAFANTVAKENSYTTSVRLARPLDQHLLRVASAADNAFRTLLDGIRDPGLWPAIAEDDLPIRLTADSTPPPAAYAWQMAAVARLRRLRGLGPDDIRRAPLFAIMPARTGTGKTLAAPRAIAAATGATRFTFAVGLRTLTLQTADAYREQIGFSPNQMAAHIGDRLALKLHQLGHGDDEEASLGSDFGQESDDAEMAIEGGSETAELPQALNRLLSLKDGGKWRRLLSAPVVACTIDTLAEAMDRSRGRHIEAEIRLASADLIIDEADAFDVPDLMAMARLVHLSGLYGRKVIIASASLPHALSLGLFKAYASGVALHRMLTGKPADDAFHVAYITDQVESMAFETVRHDGSGWETAFAACLDRWTEAETARLTATRPKERRRMGWLELPPEDLTQDAAFAKITGVVLDLHGQHHIQAEASGRRIRLSTGAVRLTRVKAVCAYAEHLASQDLPSHVALRMVVYHARLFPAVRNAVETLLDGMMLRKPDADGRDPLANHPKLRGLLDGLPDGVTDVAIVIVASPVIEAGRDHDYDWIITEPTSMRSVLQVAGRCLRHRLDRPKPEAANVLVLDYPLSIFDGDANKLIERPDLVYRRPGSGDALPLKYYSAAGHRAHANGLMPSVWENGIDAAPILSPLTKAAAEVMIKAEHPQPIALADLLPLAALMGNEESCVIGKKAAEKETYLATFIKHPLNDWTQAGLDDAAKLAPWLQWSQEKLYRFRDDRGWRPWQIVPSYIGELSLFGDGWKAFDPYRQQGPRPVKVTWTDIAEDAPDRFLLSFRLSEILDLVRGLKNRLEAENACPLLSVSYGRAKAPPDQIDADPTLGMR